MRTTRLRTGEEIDEGIAARVYHAMVELFVTDPVAWAEAQHLAKCPGQPLFGTAGQRLRAYGLVANGELEMDAATRAVVLACVADDGRGLVSPIQDPVHSTDPLHRPAPPHLPQRPAKTRP
ncbi:hypothetical protein [Allokutzneria albata]|uniref:Uncharacterized protein n=1 Tax=Allokutzneria albata TaxID=211114 RepID=A0A1H0DVM6_ALLAB|nr:hypothetical protein [Allokutzneria albata]SDN74210.1 hypothetical protein SAMN04489726_8019 [Allokutzneria albata]